MSDPGGGRVVGKGRFRVDRRRALEKMERFQLEDPHRYVLEWIAAGVVSGAERIDVVNDADDLRIHWTCDPAPTGDDLDGLFDHLWGSPRASHEAMLQHLGLGVLGALGLSPRWVHVDSRTDAGDVRLAVVDPTDTRHEALGTDEVDGVRCHVRERLTATTVREALTAIFLEPTEARLIQGAARWAPITINGRRIARQEPPSTAVLDHRLPTGRLWFAVGPTPGIDVVRHGIVVGHLAIRVGPFSVGGGWWADDVRLNASRSQVVEDERWRRTCVAVQAAVDRVLCNQIGPALAASDRRTIVWYGEGDRARLAFRSTHDELLQRLAAAGILRQLEGERPLGGLEDVPALPDMTGTVRSLREVRRAEGLRGTAARVFDDPEFTRGRLLFTDAAAEVVRAALPDIPDWTEELEQRGHGRRRRAEAERARQAPRFEGPHRAARDGPLAVAVRWRPGLVGRDGTILVHVRIGGIPLCTTEVDGPAGRLEAVVDDPRFSADPAFRNVIRDPLFAAALARMRREAFELLVDGLAAAQSAPTDGDVRVLTELLARNGGQQLGEIVGAVDPRLRTLRLLRTGGREILSLEQIAARPWWVASILPPGCSPALANKILIVPPDVRPRWERWLGHERGAEEVLLARVERERRLAAPRRPAVLSRRRAAEVPIDAPGFRGAVAAGYPPQGPSQITVLRDGVAVCTAQWPLALEGVVGIIDGPELEVTPAHDALAPEGETAVLTALRPAVDQLALALWRGLPAGATPHEALLDWLRTRSHADAGPLVVARRFDGTELTVAALRALGRKTQKTKLKVVAVDVDGVAGFDDAVPHSDALQRLLNHLAPKAWRDATSEVRRAHTSRARFLLQSRWTEPPALARRTIDDRDSGWSGTALLPQAFDDLKWPSEGADCGRAQITVLVDGRVLVTETGFGNGAWLVVSGPDLQPNHTYTGLVRRTAIQRLQRRANELLGPLIDDALAAGASVVAAPTWLTLVAHLADSAKALERAMVQRIERLPMLRRLGGDAVSLAQVRDARSARKVADTVADGPTDDTLYVRDVPGLDAALVALYDLRLNSGDQALATWRRGDARRRKLAPREPVVQTAHPVLARRPLRGGGEVALLGSGSPPLEPGLRIEPLVDGRPLGPEVFPLAVAASAVVTGEGVVADPEFERVVPNPGFSRRLADIRAVVEVLVHARLQELATDRLTASAHPWAWTWLLAETRTAEVELDAPVFPLVDGATTTLRELVARVARDGALAVSARPGSMPRGPQPVLLTPPLSTLLAARFAVVELTAAQWVEPKPRPWATVPRPPRRGGLALGPGGIEIRVDGVRVLLFHAPKGTVALEGWIDDPALTPNALWNDIARDDAWTALLAWITAAARERIVAEAERPDPPLVLLDTLMSLTSPPPPDPGDPVLQALYAARLLPDSAGGRVSLGSLLAAGTPVRRVPAQTRGEPLPGRPPFVAVSDTVRDWLATLVPVVEAQDALRNETLGAERRRQPIRRKPLAPADAARWRGSGEWVGAEMVLWLARPDEPAPPQVLVGGRSVGAYLQLVPGLTGWIDGPFETDDSFSRATLPAEVVAEAEAMVAALLQAEADTGPAGRERVFRRLLAAMGGGKLKDVVKRPWWGELALFVNTAGEPLRLSPLLAAAQRQRRVVWDHPGSAPDALVVAASNDLTWLAQLLPGIRVHHREAQRQKRERKAEEAQGAREARAQRRALVEAVASLGASSAQVDAWLERSPDVPLETDAERILAAWEIVSGHDLGPGELDVIAAVAERLVGR